MSVLTHLKTYLQAQPQPWATLAKRLSTDVGFWAAERMESTSAIELSTPDGANPDFVSEELLAFLLAPETVRKLLGTDFRSGDHRTKTEAHVKTDLADYVANFLVTTFIAGEEGRPSADFGQAPLAKLYKRHSNLPWVAEGVFGQVEVFNLVSRCTGEPIDAQSDSTTRVPDRIICLDVIDAALYRALQGHPELLKSLHWRTFERLLADLLEKSGYEIDLQQGTKDGGVDLYAVKRHGMFGNERYLLQAKRWSNSVDVKPVRQLVFLQNHHRVTKSCLATTSAFTKGAWELADQYRWQLELKDFNGLKEWLSSVANRLVI